MKIIKYSLNEISNLIKLKKKLKKYYVTVLGQVKTELISN